MTIARNAKDILLKHLAVTMGEVGLAWMGVQGVQVIAAIPTELDEVDIRSGFIDVGFTLADGTLLHIEFQTTLEPNLYRFLLYDARLTATYCKPVRTVVLYTQDVHDAPTALDAGGLQYRLENVYLRDRDGLAALRRLQQRVAHDDFGPQDRMDLAFLPFMAHPGSSDGDVLTQTVNLALSLKNRSEQDYAAALILGLSGRVLSEEDQKRLKEALRMTDLVKEMLDETDQKARQEGIEQGIERGIERGKEQVARNLLGKGMDVADVQEATGLSLERVEELKKAAHRAKLDRK